MKVPGYRQQVEQRVAQASGYPLQIGSLDLGWHGLLPTLILHEVSIPAQAASDEAAAPILQLGELRARLQPVASGSGGLAAGARGTARSGAACGYR